KEYLEEGANVTLGTDGPASNNSLNMFETMKISALLQKHHYWKADAFNCQNILDSATLNGAKALGLNAGSVEKGKLADLVFLDARAPNFRPVNDLLSNLVYSAHPGNVKKVIVNGDLVI
ncbi:amidohydrolase family protein, partial [Candidatus Micrarchaeota archaeon]|nr:amidohydrolase family protein [Candidatus Micrarchaeota archaeon]